MEYSFYIWLARNNKAWPTKEIDLALKTPEIHFKSRENEITFSSWHYK